MKPGTVQNLKVLREIPTGYVLTNGKIECLLHRGETKETLEEGQEVRVFLYKDKKGQLVATMSIPKISEESYGWCPVVEVVRNLGVFVNVGMQKDLLLSKDDLPKFKEVWPLPGDEVLVALQMDKKGNLLAKLATESIVEEALNIAPDSMLKQDIGGRVYYTDREGSVIMTEEGYRGFIHYTERKQEPRLGEWVNGRVIAVKEDGTLNVSLKPLKQEGIHDDAEDILNYLEKAGGTMPYHDKSDPEEIRKVFNMSKAAFKRALGRLMKEGKVEQKDNQTVLKKGEV